MLYVKMVHTNEASKLIEEFHRMWDKFPGPVRLIDKNHMIIAANTIAIEKGFQVGLCCARVGEPCSHRGCKSVMMLKSGLAQTDRPDDKRIRGWVPVEGYEDIYVHYTLQIPEGTNQ